MAEINNLMEMEAAQPDIQILVATAVHRIAHLNKLEAKVDKAVTSAYLSLSILPVESAVQLLVSALVLPNLPPRPLLEVRKLSIGCFYGR